MAGKNGNWGGIREGQGRPPKAKEHQLIEKLTPLDEVAFKALAEALEDAQGWAVKLFMEYRFGKPRETKDIHIKEMPEIQITYGKELSYNEIGEENIIT